MFRSSSWSVLRLETLWQDVRYGARMLRRSPGFAAAAILTFALGIGANTAIFSIVDAAILRPLPYDEPDRIVNVRQHNPQTGRQTDGMMPRDFLDWRERTDLFEHMALIGGGAFTLVGDGEPEEIRVNRVTEGFFEMMRVQPMFGRAFTRADEEPGRERVAILSHAFWKTRLGAAPDVIGRPLRLNGQPYEIVGVLPERFVYPAGARRPTPVFLPFTFTGEDRQRGVIQSMTFGPTLRLKDGKTREEVEAALSQLQAAADPRKLAFNKGYTRVELTPLIEEYVGTARSWMLMLLGAVALVLLIACANVANLVLAHGTARVRELTVRGALGASRWRIARQLLAESLLLASVGAAAGLAVAWWGIGVLRSALPPGIPRASTIGMDLRVLAFTAAAAIATGLVCGLFPALQGSRLDLTTGMKEGSGASGGTAGRRVRHVLAWVEVALAVMLLVGAGLFISSFARVLRVDYGFDARGVTTIDYGSRRLAPGEKPDLTVPAADARCGSWSARGGGGPRHRRQRTVLRRVHHFAVQGDRATRCRRRRATADPDQASESGVSRDPARAHRARSHVQQPGQPRGCCGDGDKRERCPPVLAKPRSHRATDRDGPDGRAAVGGRRGRG